MANSDDPNRKNGKGSKTIKTGSGSFELNAPRDRSGTFEPQLIKKNQTQLTPEIDRKILSLFSHGMSELLSNVVYGLLKRQPVFDRQFV